MRPGRFCDTSVTRNREADDRARIARWHRRQQLAEQRARRYFGHVATNQREHDAGDEHEQQRVQRDALAREDEHADEHREQQGVLRAEPERRETER
jgi:hypothetical protein